MRNACRRCRSFRRLLIDVGFCGKTVVRAGIFSLTIPRFGFAMQFLKDVDLLRSKVQCHTCGRDMTWSAEPSIPEGFSSRCRRKVAGVKCSESRSIKNGSWFRQSKLTFSEILLVTYNIVCREPACLTREEYGLS